jgi:hypothetical protein
VKRPPAARLTDGASTPKDRTCRMKRIETLRKASGTRLDVAIPLAAGASCARCAASPALAPQLMSSARLSARRPPSPAPMSAGYVLQPCWLRRRSRRPLHPVRRRLSLVPLVIDRTRTLAIGLPRHAGSLPSGRDAARSRRLRTPWRINPRARQQVVA